MQTAFTNEIYNSCKGYPTNRNQKNKKRKIAMKNVEIKEVVKFVNSQVRYNVKTAQKGKQSESKMFETQRTQKK